MKLPDKPSDLIDHALKDLKKAEADPDLEINMECAWVGTPSENRGCPVCLAGAVMRFSLGAAPRTFPSQYDTETMRKLMALDHFRMGKIQHAMGDLRAYCEDFRDEVPVTPYWFDPDKFKADLRNIANIVDC